MPDVKTRLETALAGRYAVEREIGRGGMATVYLAQDLKHSRPVAVKVLHPHLAVQLGADRFLHEIQIAARLNHPHILTLIDSGEAGGLLYYVMPFVVGESLRDRLSRQGALPVEEALQIARDGYVLLGEKEKALQCLEGAVFHGYAHKEWMKHDTDLDPLRDDPRFLKLLAGL